MFLSLVLSVIKYFFNRYYAGGLKNFLPLLKNNFQKISQKTMAIILIINTVEPPVVITNGIAIDVQSPPPMNGSCSNCL